MGRRRGHDTSAIHCSIVLCIADLLLLFEIQFSVGNRRKCEAETKKERKKREPSFLLSFLPLVPYGRSHGRQKERRGRSERNKVEVSTVEGPTTQKGGDGATGIKKKGSKVHLLACFQMSKQVDAGGE